MHTTTTTTTTSKPSLPFLPLSSRKAQVTKSPYPSARKLVTSTTPGRKAYSQLRSMASSFRLAKLGKSASRETAAMAEPCSDEGHVPGGQLALGHNKITRAPLRETAPTHVPGGQLAPGRVKFIQVEPHETTVPVDEYYGYAQVAKTSAPFLSTVLECPEILPSADPTEVYPDLARYIAFALSSSLLPLCVHQYALHLIWRVKYLNPDFRPKHAHGTYLTALMLAAKQSHDLEYSIDYWASIGKDIFEPSQLRDNEWRMCERLGWKLLVRPTDLIKLTWTIEVEYGELDEGAPLSSAAHVGSGLGCGAMFANSVASSLSSLSTSSSSNLDSPWSGWGDTTPSGSSFSTPLSNGPICGSAFPFPFPSA